MKVQRSDSAICRVDSDVPDANYLALFVDLVSCGWLVEIFLETGEDFADLFGAAEVGDGVGDGVVVFEVERGG